ncbi:hypothetical protein AtubIFM57143_010441 [Aspergillus tubingensis]|nr:hypothetical protein AtubIFM57143_010441 [Aspergillus tubingensis]
MMYDALIIGGGPAGLAAAMSLGRACCKTALFDSQVYRNGGVTMMHNVLRHDGEKPEFYRATAVEEIMDKYDTVSFIDTHITTARHVEEYPKRPFFELKDERGNTWLGRKLVLATGTEDVLPPVKGYKELWGRGIVHCLFCDGFEKRGGHVGVFRFETATELIPLLTALPLAGNQQLTIFTDGDIIDANKEIQHALDIAAARGAKFDKREVTSVSENSHTAGIRMHFSEGPDQDLRMLIHSPPNVNRGADIIASLGLETQPGPGGHVITKTAMRETSLRGCFAAGDTSTSAKIVSVALATGKLTSVFKPYSDPVING